MRATAIPQLATIPIKSGQDIRCGNWSAYDLDNDTRYIYHYNTHMVTVRFGQYYQVSLGWNSMTDKSGLAKLRKALGVTAKWGITQDLDNALVMG